MGLILMFAGCSRSPQAAPATAVNLSDQLKQGKAVYARTCSQCHYDGHGSPIAPKLRGSAVLAEPPATLARLILKGQSRVTVVDGKKFNGVMPPQGYLSNDEIAAVVVYVREVMAEKNDPFTPYDASLLR